MADHSSSPCEAISCWYSFNVTCSVTHKTHFFQLSSRCCVSVPKEAPALLQAHPLSGERGRCPGRRKSGYWSLLASGSVALCGNFFDKVTPLRPVCRSLFHVREGTIGKTRMHHVAKHVSHRPSTEDERWSLRNPGKSRAACSWRTFVYRKEIIYGLRLSCELSN